MECNPDTGSKKLIISNVYARRTQREKGSKESFPMWISHWQSQWIFHTDNIVIPKGEKRGTNWLSVLRGNWEMFYRILV